MGRSIYNASWRELLASPPCTCHVLQIYDSDDFLETAVGHFAAEGLQRGEAVLLTGTGGHLAGIQRKLRLRGVDVDAALRSGQLAPEDVHVGLAAIMEGNDLAPARFQARAGDAIGKLRADARFSGVRWWGEITNTLFNHGNRGAGLQAETLADATARKYDATVFCSFLCDRFDPQAYESALDAMCRVHSHFIPAEDYVQHRLAVNRAIAEVVGRIDGSLLQSLSSWKGLGCDLPSSQAVLFWLRDALPEHFGAVLERARSHLSRLECASDRTA